MNKLLNKIVHPKQTSNSPKKAKQAQTDSKTQKSKSQKKVYKMKVINLYEYTKLNFNSSSISNLPQLNLNSISTTTQPRPQIDLKTMFLKSICLIFMGLVSIFKWETHLCHKIWSFQKCSSQNLKYLISLPNLYNI